MNISDIDRRIFEARYFMEPMTGCWIWTGTYFRYNYGQIRIKRKKYLAHRISWALHNGRYPGSKEFICHKCDTPPCVNPYHLYAGTALDNSRDMLVRGRNYFKKTHCPKGHPYSDENTLVIKKSGVRYCKACQKINRHNYYMKHKK